MSKAIGKRRWVIAEGFIPKGPGDEGPTIISHETACILNTGDRKASIRVTIYFSDRDPVGPYEVTVEPRRTKHVRFNELQDPAPIPRETSYSSVFESDVPIVVQHTRIDAREKEKALLSTMAFASD